MTKTEVFLRRLILPAFLLAAVNLSALNISSFKKDADGEAAVSFCGSFRIEHIALENKGFGPVVAMPQEPGGYKNLILASRNLAERIRKCFYGSCAAPKCAPGINFKIKRARLFKSKKGIVAVVNFDGELDAVFLVSKYKKEEGETFRLKYPSDLKFENSALKQQVRAALIKEAKKYL